MCSLKSGGVYFFYLPLSPMKLFPFRQCFAEFLGTFLLAVGVGVTIGISDPPVPTLIMAGMILGTMVYTVGSVSGAQLNPAVTIGLFSIGKMKREETLWYLASQIAGAAFAHMLLARRYILTWNYGYSSWAAGAEMLGAFILVWGVCSVVYKKVDPAASGLVIGTSLSIGAAVASIGSFAVINPAVAFGLNLISLTYFLCPIVGGIFAAQLYRWTINAKAESL